MLKATLSGSTGKVMAFLLILVMLFTSMPVLAYADEGETGGSSGETPYKTGAPDKTAEGYLDEDYPSGDSEGFVRVEKSAAWTDEMLTEAEVKFDVRGKPIDKGVDVIMIYDRSGSMTYNTTGSSETNGDYKTDCHGEDLTYVNKGREWEYNNADFQKQFATCDDCKTTYSRIIRERSSSRIYTYKARLNFAEEAAYAFADNILSGSKNRIALVSFNGGSDTNVGFTSSSAAFKSAIDRMTYMDGTNYIVGMNEALDLLEKRKTDSDDSRDVKIIFVSDGQPENSNTTNRTEALLAKAGALKAAGATEIYSVGFGTSSIGGALEAVAGFSTNTSDAENVQKYVHKNVSADELETLFKRIANNMKIAGTEAVLEDFVNTEFFELDPDKDPVSSDPSDAVTVSGQSVEWKFGNITETTKTLTIYIKLKQEYIDKNASGIYPTNEGNATLDYINFNDKNCTQYVESPVLSRPNGLVQVDFYLVDGDGNPISIKDHSLQLFKDRENITDPQYLTSDGSLSYTPESLVPNRDYTVTAPATFVEYGTEGGVLYKYTYTYVPDSSASYENKADEYKLGNPNPFSFKLTSPMMLNFGYKVEKEEVTQYTANYDGNASSVNRDANTVSGVPDPDTGLLSADITPYAVSSSEAAMTDDDRYSYEFKGWSLDPEGDETDVTGTVESANFQNEAKAITLYAIWAKTELNQYNAYYDGNASSVGRSDTSVHDVPGPVTGLTYSEINPYAVTDDKPTMDDGSIYSYAFKGWSLTTNGAVVTTVDAIKFQNDAKAVTLYAIWDASELEQYSVVYEKNASLVGMDDASVSNMPDNVSGLTYSEINPYTVSSKEAIMASDGIHSYEFKGWATSQNGTPVTTVAATEFDPDSKTVTLYAIWASTEIGQYNVYYDGNASSVNRATDSVDGVPAAQTGLPYSTINPYAVSTDTPTMIDGTNYAYTFVGWSLSTDGAIVTTVAATSFNNDAKAVTLYAIWEASELEQYNVVYDGNASSVNRAADSVSNIPAAESGLTYSEVSPYTVSTDKAIMSDGTNYSYTFEGWALTTGGTPVDTVAYEKFNTSSKAVTLYAIWASSEIEQYNVVYDGNASSVNRAADTVSNIPAAQAGMPYSKVNPYTVSTDKAIMTDDANNAYTFVGWALTTGGTPVDTVAYEKFNTSSKTVTLYAIWTSSEIEQYNVVYDGNASSVGRASDTVSNIPAAESGLTYSEVSPYTVSTDKAIMSAGTNDTYTFVGWSLKADGTDNDVVDEVEYAEFNTGSKTVTLYAIWESSEIEQYNVIYNGNETSVNKAAGDATGVPSAQNGLTYSNVNPYAVSDAKAAITEDADFRYEFKGWSLKADGTENDVVSEVEYENFNTSSKTVNLYAIWAKYDNPTITFDAGAAGSSASNMPAPASFKVPYDSTQQIYKDYNVPNWNGYVFLGWKESDSMHSGKAFNITEDKYYVAQWESATGDADLTHIYYENGSVYRTDGPSKTDITTAVDVPAFGFANKPDSGIGFRSVPFKVEIINQSAITGTPKTIIVNFEFETIAGEIALNSVEADGNSTYKQSVPVVIDCYNGDYIFTEDMYKDALDEVIADGNITISDYMLGFDSGVNLNVNNEKSLDFEFVSDGNSYSADDRAPADAGEKVNKTTGGSIVFTTAEFTDNGMYKFNDFGKYSIIAHYNKVLDEVKGEDADPVDGDGDQEVQGEDADPVEDQKVLGQESKTSDSMSMTLLALVIALAALVTALTMILRRRQQSDR